MSQVERGVRRLLRSPAWNSTRYWSWSIFIINTLIVNIYQKKYHFKCSLIKLNYINLLKMHYAKVCDKNFKGMRIWIFFNGNRANWYIHVNESFWSFKIDIFFIFYAKRSLIFEPVSFRFKWHDNWWRESIKRSG